MVWKKFVNLCLPNKLVKFFVVVRFLAKYSNTLTYFRAGNAYKK